MSCAELSLLQREITPLIQNILSSREGRELIGERFHPGQSLLFKETSDELIVESRGDLIKVHHQFPQHLIKLGLSWRRVRVRAALYVIHEIIHFNQNISGYENVQRVRAVSDSILLEFDLEADHLAALLLNRYGDQTWSLDDLKREQIECLYSFPVTHQHSDLARLRKVQRLISLCAELILRRAGELRSDSFVIFRLRESYWNLISKREVLTRRLGSGDLLSHEMELLMSGVDKVSYPLFFDRLKLIMELISSRIIMIDQE
jgi:hypothetical protein